MSTTASEQDFTQWYAASFARVRRAVTLAVGDAGLAEEATAEAFARALVHWRSVSRMSHPEAWVYRVASNWAMSMPSTMRGDSASPSDCWRSSKPCLGS